MNSREIVQEVSLLLKSPFPAAVGAKDEAAANHYVGKTLRVQMPDGVAELKVTKVSGGKVHGTDSTGKKQLMSLTYIDDGVKAGKVKVVEETATVAEASEKSLEDLDGDELLLKWERKNKVQRYEGSKGVNDLEDLVRTLGYRDMDYFLEDNMGAMTAIRDFIEEWIDKVAEWKEKLIEDLEE